LIALAVMLGTTLEVLDSSIINVALRHLQGSFSASVDEIVWALTSYLVANGIMIPMTGWMSSRFGRERYFLASVFVFVTASTLCGCSIADADGAVPPGPGRRGRRDDSVVAKPS
jgi:DHA2 family multidrug resistance protein